MKSYALEKYGLSRGGIVCGNIVMMRKKMYNRVGSINLAPNRFRLIEFGGDMTIDQFRENLTIDEGTPTSVETVPMIDVVVPPVETKNPPPIHTSALKLKRTKPLKRNHNNLESALGLIITPNS
jgi:hypothetical protein